MIQTLSVTPPWSEKTLAPVVNLPKALPSASRSSGPTHRARAVGNEIHTASARTGNDGLRVVDAFEERRAAIPSQTPLTGPPALQWMGLPFFNDTKISQSLIIPTSLAELSNKQVADPLMVLGAIALIFTLTTVSGVYAHTSAEKLLGDHNYDSWPFWKPTLIMTAGAVLAASLGVAGLAMTQNPDYALAGAGLAALISSIGFIVIGGMLATTREGNP